MYFQIQPFFISPHQLSMLPSPLTSTSNIKNFDKAQEHSIFYPPYIVWDGYILRRTEKSGPPRSLLTKFM